MNPLNNKIFQNAEAARDWLETLLWTDGRVCGYCGVVNESTPIASRPGYFQCNACRKQFTVMVGTVFERSHIPLNKWLMAAFLICSSKKGMSAHQLHRMLGITYKSAWFMEHRLREAMAPLKAGPLGGEGKIVEADATFIGGKEKNKHVGQRNPKAVGGLHKAAVHALVERDGAARSHHVSTVHSYVLNPVMRKNVSRKSLLMTDSAGSYRIIGKEFAGHETVNHEKSEYVRGIVHTNTVEGFFAILKRGIVGTYHHVSEAHLQLYLAEFDFRYSNRQRLGVNDEMRTEKMLKGIVGKRLTYRRTDEAAH